MGDRLVIKLANWLVRNYALVAALPTLECYLKVLEFLEVAEFLEFFKIQSKAVILKYAA